MKQSNSIKKLAAICLIGLTAATSSQAVIVAYPSPGTINATTYSFTATGPGVVTAYFVGSSAGFGSVVGMSVNGAAPLIFGLQNNSTLPGTPLILGPVLPGDTINFVLAVDDDNGLGPLLPADVDYFLNNDPALNPVPGDNHFYAAPYAGGDFGIPAGTYTYVGIEDISPLTGPPGFNDLDYNDHQFAFSGPFDTVATPEGGSTLALMGAAALAIAGLRRWLK